MCVCVCISAQRGVTADNVRAELAAKLNLQVRTFCSAGGTCSCGYEVNSLPVISRTLGLVATWATNW